MCENVILRQDGRGRCEVISKLGVCMTCCWWHLIMLYCELSFIKTCRTGSARPWLNLHAARGVHCHRLAVINLNISWWCSIVSESTFIYWPTGCYLIQHLAEYSCIQVAKSIRNSNADTEEELTHAQQKFTTFSLIVFIIVKIFSAFYI